jgi:hypothetical protein
MEDKKIFQLNNGITLEELVRLLEQYLNLQKHLTTQKFNTGNRAIIQCVDSDSSWKQFLGLDAALTVELEETGNNQISVKIGNAKWLDKVGVAAVGALFFSPLIVAAGIGAVRQAALPAEIFSFIQARTEGTAEKTSSSIFDNGFHPENIFHQNTEENNTAAVCPCCGNPIKDSYAFCSKCGTKL